MTELLPCPNCGDAVKIEYHQDCRYLIRCANTRKIYVEHWDKEIDCNLTLIMRFPQTGSSESIARDMWNFYAEKTRNKGT